MARNAVLTIILVCILGSIHHTTIFYVRFQNEIAPQTYLDDYTGVAEEEGVLQQSTNTTIVAANADDDNENGRRAIVLVSMGGSEMNMVERFVWYTDPRTKKPMRIDHRQRRWPTGSIDRSSFDSLFHRSPFVCIVSPRGTLCVVPVSSLRDSLILM